MEQRMPPLIRAPCLLAIWTGSWRSSRICLYLPAPTSKSGIRMSYRALKLLEAWIEAIQDLNEYQQQPRSQQQPLAAVPLRKSMLQQPHETASTTRDGAMP